MVAASGSNQYVDVTSNIIFYVLSDIRNVARLPSGQHNFLNRGDHLLCDFSVARVTLHTYDHSIFYTNLLYDTITS